MTESPLLGEGVYLAGAITGISYEESMGWREYMIEELNLLGYDVYSPMRHKRNLHDKFGDAPLPSTDESFRDPFERDKQDIKRADYAVFNFLHWKDHPELKQIGSICELGMATMDGTYCIVVWPEEMEMHPFISGPANDVVHSIDEALLLLEEYRPIVPD